MHRLVLPLVLAFAAGAFAQSGGEGNGFGATLTTGSFTSPATDLDRPVLPGQLLDISIQSTGSPFGRPVLVYSPLPCGVPQPANDFGPEIGILGIDPFYTGIIFDSFAAYPPAVIGFLGFNMSIVLPDWVAPDGFEDIFLQAAVWDPTTGSPLGWSVTNTVRWSTVQPGPFQNDAARAACAPALGGADLGIPQLVNTAGFANTYEVTGVAPGQGTTAVFGIDETVNSLNLSTGSGDAVARFVAPAAGNYSFSLCDSDFDTLLYLVSADGTTPLLCNDDGLCPLGGGASELVQPLLAGQEVLVVIDGLGPGKAGNAQLTIGLLP